LKVAIIGRIEVLYDTSLRLDKAGHKIVCILSTKEAPKNTRTTADFKALAENGIFRLRRDPASTSP